MTRTRGSTALLKLLEQDRILVRLIVGPRQPYNFMCYLWSSFKWAGQPELGWASFGYENNEPGELKLQVLPSDKTAQSYALGYATEDWSNSVCTALGHDYLAVAVNLEQTQYGSRNQVVPVSGWLPMQCLAITYHELCRFVLNAPPDENGYEERDMQTRLAKTLRDRLLGFATEQHGNWSRVVS